MVDVPTDLVAGFHFAVIVPRADTVFLGEIGIADVFSFSLLFSLRKKLAVADGKRCDWENISQHFGICSIRMGWEGNDLLDRTLEYSKVKYEKSPTRRAGRSLHSSKLFLASVRSTYLGFITRAPVRSYLLRTPYE